MRRHPMSPRGLHLLLSLAPAAALLLGSLPAAAATQFPSAYTRKVKLTVDTQARYFVIAQDGNLYWKPESGSWQKIDPPSGITFFDYTFGATGVQTSSTCGSLLAVGLNYQVWEYRLCGGSSGWYSHGNGGGSLWDNPPIAATLRASTGEIIVATVGNADQRLRILRFPVGGGSDLWLDAGGSVDDTASLDINLEPSPDGNPDNDNDADIWVRDTSGRLAQYTFRSSDNNGSWNNSHGWPAVGVSVSAVGIQAHWSPSQHYNVFVKGSDHHLWLRRKDQGNPWQQWIDLGVPPNDQVSGGRNALAYPRSDAEDKVYVVGMTNQKLWRCDYHYLSASCTSWTNGGTPPDSENGARWGLLAESLNNVYLSATVGLGARYVDAVHLSATEKWRSHLAPVDSFVTTLPTADHSYEWVIDERNGVLLLAGCEEDAGNTFRRVQVRRSTDDGSIWSGAVYPFLTDTTSGVVCEPDAVRACDPSISFDAGGNAYVAQMPDNGTVQIAASPDGGASWSCEHTIPTGGTLDRPWLVADWRRANWLYLLYHDTSGGPPPVFAKFMYCPSGLNCATNQGTWCGPYNAPFPTTPSTSMVLAADGILYVSYLSTNDGQGECCPGGGGGGCPDAAYDQAHSVRWLDTKMLLQGCAQPTWQAAECLYFRRYYDPAQLHAPGIAVGSRHMLGAARDSSSAVMLAQISFTDLNGNPCPDNDTVLCRANVFAAWRDAGGWSADKPPNMLRVHTDPFSLWSDHIIGVPLELNYRNHLAAWMDWREDPANGDQYHLYSRWSGATLERPWEPQGDWPVMRIGDMETSANAGIHGHFVHELHPPTGTSRPALVIAAHHAH
ncbi:MAG: hypothetical protein HY744_30755 [Deltaproteobacteria bacterium]|nr:hypothetical protein [Deltaproteobacteria bacterium]